MGIHLRFNSIDAQNSTERRESYHYALRRTFEFTKSEHSKLSDKIILRISIKAIDDTMGPEGPVPSLLVFGTLPKFLRITNVSPK